MIPKTDRRKCPSKKNYRDFKLRYSDYQCFYELYRKVVAEEQISFATLGHEECWDCEQYNVHKQKNNKHDAEKFPEQFFD